LIAHPTVSPQTFCGPAERSLDRNLLIFARLVGIGTLVKRHDDVGPEVVLHLDRAGGREVDFRAVDVALETHAAVVDLVDIRERKDLKPPAVGQDRPGPSHEAVKIAELCDDFFTGAEHEMIGIRKDDLRPGRGHVIGQDAFDRALRSDGHKRGRVEGAVAGRHATQPGARMRIGVDQLVLEGKILRLRH
jgi:hypothetical protein